MEYITIFWHHQTLTTFREAMATRGRMILSYMGRLSNKSTSSTNITRAIAFSHHYRSTLVDVPSIAAPLLYPTSTNIHPPQICYSYGCLNHARSMSCCAGVGSPPPREVRFAFDTLSLIAQLIILHLLN